MKNRIKNKIKAITGIRSLENKLNILNKENEVIALQLLKDLMPKSIFIPLTLWSISPSAMLHVANEIIINKRKNIIEFGSGFSTFIISQLIKQNNLNVNFYSVESNSEWLEIMERDLRAENIFDNVNLIYSPLSKSKYEFNEHEIWYDTQVLDKLLSNTKFDMVIVDGPPGQNKYSRYAAIPYLINKMSKDFFVLLDDTNRVEENEIIIEWNNQLKANLISYNNYTTISSDTEFNSNPVFSRIF